MSESEIVIIKYGVAFVAGALADHYLESKIKALRSELAAKAASEVKTVQADVTKVEDAAKKIV